MLGVAHNYSGNPDYQKGVAHLCWEMLGVAHNYSGSPDYALAVAVKVVAAHPYFQTLDSDPAAACPYLAYLIQGVLVMKPDFALAVVEACS
ncbi:hypothetical protein Scep_015544 [Stephania cephalantha]|uniref:Uncharacterized protein n=1 Tax=Stephania cephalantha TaxID=152367 RepID=A0AAP0P1F6_9MAGN